ncbi:MAG: low molecular weight protein-tyrosine-phosphatase [Anaerolineae bacterium]
MHIQVLFVCLGNICRSPMAEAVFREMVKEAGLSAAISVDSAGTGSWHVGERAHRGTRKVLAKHDISYDGRARQVRHEDITAVNSYIIAMDQSNLLELQHRFGRHPRMHLLLDFATHTNIHDVPDPYYSGNFEIVYELVQDGCRGLLATIRQQQGL